MVDISCNTQGKQPTPPYYSSTFAKTLITQYCMNQPRVEHWSYDPYAETVNELLGAAPVLLNRLVSADLLNSK